MENENYYAMRLNIYSCVKACTLVLITEVKPGLRCYFD